MTRHTDSIFARGAVIVPDFLTPAEEERILLRIAQAPWMTELRRRVQHYGYRYDYRGTDRPEPAAPFPRWADYVADRLREHFGGALPVQCIVNEYRPGQGIGMHADHRDFGPVVASLSLAAGWPMRFRPRSVRPYARDGLPVDEVIVLPRRSVLVLAGAARSEWMHGIDPADTAGAAETRVSTTFRTLAPAVGRP
ncbi:MAG: alpha-ketoglutarate-dependent dioxygenase AlkB [Rhodospirillaceae bacterium]|nr:alpha-ketoglutarate-dependent dioxygenase AlkB [Rhodospirillaceae bacterium]